MLLTTFFVKDSLVKSNVSEAQSNLLNYNSIIANQVAPFISNIDNEYTFKYVDDIIKQNSLEYGARTLVLTTGNQVLVDSYDLLRATSIDNRETDAASTGNDISNIYVYGDYYMQLYQL